MIISSNVTNVQMYAMRKMVYIDKNHEQTYKQRVNLERGHLNLIEEIEDEYLHLYSRMNIMGDFWLSSAITTQVLSPTLINKYSLIIFQEFYPYLTSKGKEQFSSITS